MWDGGVRSTMRRRALVQVAEKIRAVLTPEQQEKVQAMKEEREDRREDCLAHSFMNLKELDLTESASMPAATSRARAAGRWAKSG